MLDSYNRDIKYLRISLLDNCNLRCIYCMPDDNVTFMDKNNWLQFEDICSIVEASTKLGFEKFRLTGGEPLLRPNIEKLIAMNKKIENVKIIAMTTNATYLDHFALKLKKAGLDSVNISLDTLDSKRYSYITRGGNIEDVLKGINKAFEVGLAVKINTVIIDETSLKEVEHIKKFIESKGGKLQTINIYRLDKQKDDNHSFDRPPKCLMCSRLQLQSIV